jgi:hypothetical protein
MYLAFTSCTLKAIHFVSLGVGKEMRPNSEKICNNNKIETQIGNVGQYRNDKKGHNAQKKKKKNSFKFLRVGSMRIWRPCF